MHFFTANFYKKLNIMLKTIIDIAPKISLVYCDWQIRKYSKNNEVFFK